MELNYVLLFIIGYLLGGISLFIYHYKRINSLRADITDKKIINQLIKDYVDKLPKVPNTRKRKYNGKQKTKKANSSSRQDAKKSG